MLVAHQQQLPSLLVSAAVVCWVWVVWVACGESLSACGADTVATTTQVVVMQLKHTVWCAVTAARQLPLQQHAS